MQPARRRRTGPPPPSRASDTPTLPAPPLPPSPLLLQSLPPTRAQVGVDGPLDGDEDAERQQQGPPVEVLVTHARLDEGLAGGLQGGDFRVQRRRRAGAVLARRGQLGLERLDLGRDLARLPHLPAQPPRPQGGAEQEEHHAGVQQGHQLAGEQVVVAAGAGERRPRGGQQQQGGGGGGGQGGGGGGRTGKGGGEEGRVRVGLRSLECAGLRGATPATGVGAPPAARANTSARHPCCGAPQMRQPQGPGSGWSAVPRAVGAAATHVGARERACGHRGRPHALTAAAQGTGTLPSPIPTPQNPPRTRRPRWLRAPRRGGVAPQ